MAIESMISVAYLEGSVDTADERVQNVDVLMEVQQDEGQEGLQQGRLTDASQEQVQVRRGGHHFLDGQLTWCHPKNENEKF